ncbi:MAG: alpha/beta hydrolase [Halobacteriales archaeon]
MADAVVIPGGRDVRGSIDGPQEAAGCVVACPPHPQAGGTRTSPVLTAVGEALADRDLGTLRFDYGPWAEGAGETRDARNAVDWADDRFPAVGLFGYSFGATVALAAAGDGSVVGVVALAPGHRLPSIDTIEALESVPAPVLLLYAERDRVVDSEPTADRAQALGHEVSALPADHHFVGQRTKVAEHVGAFFDDRFSELGRAE